ncbi:transposase [Streptomyces echinatus]|uniref:transposase n=1 Tax=Streptomyces echinatus TaxID=67293 RepID=UPI003792E6CC
MRRRLPRPCEKGGADTGPSPVEPAEDGQQHHLICDGRGTPLKVITTAANVNDVTQTLALVDGIPPVAGRPGRPRRRPEALLGDKGYDSDPNAANCESAGSMIVLRALRGTSAMYITARVLVSAVGVRASSRNIRA